MNLPDVPLIDNPKTGMIRHWKKKWRSIKTKGAV